ncbi:metallophosphoesterase family protein [Oenococcus sp.]|uniref:metallophosphoesterase family protein n=1 Tax=Oenococcus sp. TaxID=1979414 RepID=UPI0039ED78E5
MKFIHAADMHLGNTINGIDRKITIPLPIRKEISFATFSAFKNVIDLAIDHHVDFILFPGDLFDSSQQSAYLYNFLNQQFESLKQAGIAAFVSFGNHDFQSDADQDFLWPDNVHVFPRGRAKTFYHDSWDGKRIAISGTSFAVRNPQESLVSLYPARDQSVAYEIGMYHGSLGDNATNQYAPFTVDQLQALNYDYWALGHIHVRQVLSKSPAIVYSGDPQGLDLTETGEKGVYLVSDEDEQQQHLSAKFLPTSKFIFQPISLTVEDNSMLPKLNDMIADVMQAKHTNKLVLNILTLNLSFNLSDKVREQLTDSSFLDLINSRSLPFKQCVIRININESGQKQPFNRLDSRFWQQAKENVFDAELFNRDIAKTFSRKEQFIIDHFTDSAVQAQLMSAAQRLISQRADV